LERTAAHEFGHQAGLGHEAPRGLMLQDRNATAGMNITGQQSKQIVQGYKHGN